MFWRAGGRSVTNGAVMRTPRALLLAASLAALVSPFSSALAEAVDFQVISWNIESGQSRPATIARQVRDDFEGIELWGFSEVQSDEVAARLESAAEEGEDTDMARITGTTGGTDRLVILYDTSRFELLDSYELSDINVSGTVRAPLVAHLRGLKTGLKVLFVVNHLYRGDNQGRHRQATMLNEWAAQQADPVITVGDFNFDWHYQNGDTDHDRGFDNLVANGVFEWVRPSVLVPTHDSDFESVLDFIFIAANQTQRVGWTASSQILVRPGDFPDDNSTSDHRPVFGTFVYEPVEEIADSQPMAVRPANSRELRPAGVTPALRPQALAADVRRATPVPAAPGADKSTEARLDQMEKKIEALTQQIQLLTKALEKK